MKKRSIGVGLMGLGIVGGGVAKVLMDKALVLAEQIGCPVVLRRIKVLAADLDRPQAQEIDPQLFTTDAEDFFTTRQQHRTCNYWLTFDGVVRHLHRQGAQKRCNAKQAHRHDTACKVQFTFS